MLPSSEFVGGAFRGIVVGLSAKETEAAFLSNGMKVVLRSFSPPATIAAGLAKRRVLESAYTPLEIVRHLVPMVLGLWAFEAILFFLAVGSFVLDWPEFARLALILAALSLGLLSIWASVLYLRRAERRGDSTALPRDLGDLAWLGGLGDPFGGVIVLGVVLAAFLLLFVLFVVWLPIILAITAMLSIGELWRDYRTVWFATDDAAALGRIGGDLLGQGAVLSKSWDPYLAVGDRVRATAIRQAHYRVHKAFVGVGLSSLALAGMGLMSRIRPADVWFLPVVAAGTATVGILAFLASALYRRRTFRLRS